MGLDMYLYAEKYVSGYDFSDSKAIYKKLRRSLGLTKQEVPDNASATLRFEVAYWRKANHIHGWFAKVVYGGRDECQTAYVSREQLQELVDLCRELLSTRDTGALPTTSGFFFGDTDIGDWYWQDLAATIKQVGNLLTNPKFKDWDFYYHASW